MAVTATVEKFGMTFADAYHKVTRLNYESTDYKTYVHSEPAVNENGEPMPVVPEEVWSKNNLCTFEVATYASAATREAHAEPIYRVHYSFAPSLETSGVDLLAQAYLHLKGQAGYEDAVDC